MPIDCLECWCNKRGHARLTPQYIVVFVQSAKSPDLSQLIQLHCAVLVDFFNCCKLHHTWISGTEDTFQKNNVNSCIFFDRFSRLLWLLIKRFNPANHAHSRFLVKKNGICVAFLCHKMDFRFLMTYRSKLRLEWLKTYLFLEDH